LILAGPISFIIMGQFFGMVAATYSCVFISALGDAKRPEELGHSCGLHHGAGLLPVLLCPAASVPPVPLAI